MLAVSPLLINTYVIYGWPFRLLLHHNALVDPLRSSRDRETPLHLAISQGFAESASLLLENGADPNAKNGRGEMPLHLACQGKCPSLISLLLDKKTLVSYIKGIHLLLSLIL